MRTTRTRCISCILEGVYNPYIVYVVYSRGCVESVHCVYRLSWNSRAICTQYTKRLWTNIYTVYSGGWVRSVYIVQTVKLEEGLESVNSVHSTSSRVGITCTPYSGGCV